MLFFSGPIFLWYKPISYNALGNGTLLQCEYIHKISSMKTIYKLSTNNFVDLIRERNIWRVHLDDSLLLKGKKKKSPHALFFLSNIAWLHMLELKILLSEIFLFDNFLLPCFLVSILFQSIVGMISNLHLVYIWDVYKTTT